MVMLLYLDDLKLYAKSVEDMATLVNTVGTFFTDIGMLFGFDKCTTLTVIRGNVVGCDGIDLSTGHIRSLSVGSSYKYMGVLEVGDFQCGEVRKI